MMLIAAEYDLTEALVAALNGPIVGCLRGSGVPVVAVNDTPVKLSVREQRLLRILSTRCGTVVSKSELLRLIWGDASSDQHVVEVTVSRLRSRLGLVGEAVVSVARRGYMLQVQRLP